MLKRPYVLAIVFFLMIPAVSVLAALLINSIDPEMFKLVLEERARARPEASKAKPEQFFDDSLVRELDKEGFFKKLFAR